MADIIDFRSKPKSRYKAQIAINGFEKMGQIILFSGVRIEREGNRNTEIQLTKAQLNELNEFLSSKTS
ncbi:MAG: hypothetical protein COC24_001445 [Alphaproteobacteria bacterium]|nr:hypothetical protein [Alphaproteobacteria bacterium]